MTPLRVRAHLRSQVSLPKGPLALDSLLIALVCERDGIPPPASPQDARLDISIPVAPAQGDRRFFLASFAVYVPERYENRFTNRRFPLDVAQDLGEKKFRRVCTTGGSCKSFRMPFEVMHVAGDQLLWFCIGDQAEIATLLAPCTGLGKRRGVGLGRVKRWDVERVEPWGDDFPCVFKGQALRTLPPTWPGLVNPPLGMRVLYPPYTDKTREEVLAYPAWVTDARRRATIAA